jgi:FixJ family two-component response regulator
MENAHPTSQKCGLLIVDDETHNLDSLERLFRSKYKIFRAQSGEEAIEVLEREKDQIQVTISDQRMPGLSGVDFFKKSLLIKPDLMRILLTGYTDLEALIDAINEAQVFRYLNKPWDPVDLQKTVDQAFEQYRLIQEVASKTKAIEQAYEQLKELDKAKSQFMILINHELKTPLTSILSYAQILAEEKLTPEQSQWLERIRKASEKLQELIEDSLTLISAETKILPLQIQKFEIGQLDTSGRLHWGALSESNFNSAASQRLETSVSEIAKWRCIGDLARVRLAIQKIDQHISHFGQSSNHPLSPIKVFMEGSRKIRFEFCYLHPTNENQLFPYQEPERWLSPFYSGQNLMHHNSFQGLALPVAHSVLKLFQSGLKIQCGKTPSEVLISFELNRIS